MIKASFLGSIIKKGSESETAWKWDTKRRLMFIFSLAMLLDLGD